MWARVKKETKKGKKKWYVGGLLTDNRYCPTVLDFLRSIYTEGRPYRWRKFGTVRKQRRQKQTTYRSKQRRWRRTTGRSTAVRSDTKDQNSRERENFLLYFAYGLSRLWRNKHTPFLPAPTGRGRSSDAYQNKTKKKT